MQRVRAFVCCLTCVLFLSCGTALASELAELTGYVSDPTGARVSRCRVQVTNIETNVSYFGDTNEIGLYRISALPVGNYRVIVQRTGFKTVVKQGVELHVQDMVSLNFQLEIGAVAESITVEGSTPLINTESASVSTVVDRNFVGSLPLNGRSFNTLLQLTPGVVIAPPVPFSTSSAGQFSISGQRSDANGFSVDGVSANFGVVATANVGNSGTGSTQAFSALGGTSSLVSADDLQEFRIETSSFAPEFGRSPGGQVILTTRSGTNAFHGGLFEYFRNDVLDANDWFNNRAGKHRVAERHNDFGGTIGGPIWRSRSFFFASYEGARLRVPQSAVLQVPSAFARGAAPQSLSPFFNAFPQPDDRTVIPSVFSSPFTSSFSNRATLDATSIRVDHRVSDRLSLFARYNYAPSELVSRPFFTFLEAAPTNTQTLTLSASMSFSQSVSNTIRANYSTQKASTSDSLDSFGGAVPLDPALLLGTASGSSGLGFFQLGTASIRTGPQSRNLAKQLNFVDDLALAVGTHLLKFGGDYRALFVDRTPFHFGTNFFAFSTQGFLSTGTASFSSSTNLPTQILAQDFSLYGQDTWKITRRLTLTYGLRWELAPAPSGRGTTELASWLNTNNLSATTLAPAGTPVWATTYGNVAPRIGLAYSLTPRGDFVVRAAFGLFYDTSLGQAGSVAGLFPNSAFGGPPSVSLPVNNFAPLVPTISLNPPFPTSSGFVDDLVLPRSYQWNVALEKSVGNKHVLTATYVGQSGRDLLRNEGLFKPNANFASFLTLETNGAWSNYDALQLQYRCKLSQGLQVLANYTWSHSLDNASDDGLQSTSDTIISGARDYANSNFDVRHTFSAGFTYGVPSASRSAALRSITRDWSLGAIAVGRSGFPFNATVLGGGPGQVVFRRPNLVPGPEWIANSLAPGGKSLNPAAFAIPPAGQQGTEPRNDIPGFVLAQIDLSIARKVAITERWNIQFRADAFNALNHPNFTNPPGVFSGPATPASNLQSVKMLNSGLGGLNPLFQEGGPRSLQLSLRVAF